MVRTGVARAFGANLRHVIARGTANRYYSFVAGLGVTAVLQSSTATALIASAFASRGLMPLATALAVMLGADVGTTLVAQLLSLKIAWLSSLFIFAGVVMFLGGKVTRWRDMGRIGIGLGLMLLALRLIFAASEPMRDAVAMHDVLNAIAGVAVLGILVAALLTWLAHSSLAVVLLVMSLTMVAVDVAVMHGYAFAGRTMQNLFRNARALKIQNRLFGGLLMAIGTGLFFVKRGSH